MSSVMVVGGRRSGEHIKWFGNRVRIDGVEHVLHRAHFMDGTRREYYVKAGTPLKPMLDADTLRYVKVLG